MWTSCNGCSSCNKQLHQTRVTKNMGSKKVLTFSVSEEESFYVLSIAVNHNRTCLLLYDVQSFQGVRCIEEN